MNILLLTQVVPFPPDSGPKIKTYNVLRYLAQRHAVHLVSYARSQDEVAHARMLERYCATVETVPLHRSRGRDVVDITRSLLTNGPFLVRRDDLPDMRAAVSRAVHSVHPDAVHADQLSMAQFAAKQRVPLRVLDEHNAVWTIVRRLAMGEKPGLRRLLAELEWRKLQKYEGCVCRQFDRLTVVSDHDRADLELAAGTRLPATIIPIALDTERIQFAPRTWEARHVLSVATMFYPPNIEGVDWFATGVFPLVRRVLPETTFVVVGSRPPRRITRLATHDTGVVVAGYVADLTPLTRQCGVFVVPVSSGSGMRVKILDAFARGIPVVSTSVGVAGIAARDTEHLLVADSPEAFAAAIVRLLSDRSLGQRLAVAARKLVEQHYDWRTALRPLDDIYGEPEGRSADRSGRCPQCP